MQELYYTPLDIAAIINSLNLRNSDKEHLITAIFIKEQERLSFKFRNDFKTLFLSISYWGHYLQNKEVIDAEFPSLKNLLTTRNIEISDGDFTADYSDLDLFFKSIRLRIRYLSKHDYVRIKLRTLLKRYGLKRRSQKLRYGLKRRSQKFIDNFLLCLWFYELQIFLPGNKPCDIRTIDINSTIIFRVKS